MVKASLANSGRHLPPFLPSMMAEGSDVYSLHVVLRGFYPSDHGCQNIYLFYMCIHDNLPLRTAFPCVEDCSALQAAR